MADELEILTGGGGGGGGLGGLLDTLGGGASDAIGAAEDVADIVGRTRDVIDDLTGRGSRDGRRGGPVALPPFQPEVPQGGDMVPSGGGIVGGAAGAIRWVMNSPFSQAIISYILENYGGGVAGPGIRSGANCKALASMLQRKHPDVFDALVLFESGVTIPIELTAKGEAVFLALQIAATPGINVCDMGD